MKRLGTAVAAAVFGIVVGLSYTVFEPENETPVWFTGAVMVPDHAVGEDPDVLYAREIARNSVGTWRVEWQRLDEEGEWDQVESCDGSGTSNYTVSEKQTKDMTLSVYAGSMCANEPGTYRLVTSWSMLYEGEDHPLIYWHKSEPFEVRLP